MTRRPPPYRSPDLDPRPVPLTITWQCKTCLTKNYAHKNCLTCGRLSPAEEEKR